jgi:hypothetical protein
MSSLPFGIRFILFAVVVVFLNILVIGGLVFLGFVGTLMLFPLPPLQIIALVVIIGVLIGLVVGWFYFGPPEMHLTNLIVVLVILMIGITALAVLGIISLGFYLVLVSLLGFLAASLFLFWFIFGVHRAPLDRIGLSGINNLPAIPFRLSDLLGTIVSLYNKGEQTQAAKDGLITNFTLGAGTPDAKTATGKDFVYGDGESRFLDAPEQYAMGWTTVDDLAGRAAPFLAGFAATLTDAVAATAAFWPTLANFSTPFGIVPLEKVTPERGATLTTDLGHDFSAAMTTALDAGLLYQIDLTLFDKLEPPTTDNPRFTPATLTLLIHDPNPLTFTPVLVRVSNGASSQIYTTTEPSTWIYALQAVKASLTVWGIWLGHTHHWHVVTSAMQMTMYQYLQRSHPIRQVLELQSAYMIGFDEFLLIDWNIAPPTSLQSSDALIRMVDRYCAGRSFFDDDPDKSLDAQGLDIASFTSPPGDPLRAPWNLWPMARFDLTIHRAAKKYIDGVVMAVYANDAAVTNDGPLQNWLKFSGDPGQGNVRGIGRITTRQELVDILASLIYRITQHGMNRLAQAANVVFDFVANWPPCLEDSRLPDPATPLSTAALLKFLPKTGTIGEMLSFLYAFSYSTVYASLIPNDGVDADLPFEGQGMSGMNAALVQFRTEIRDFITLFVSESNRMLPGLGLQVTPEQIHQWELSIEL